MSGHGHQKNKGNDKQEQRYQKDWQINLLQHSQYGSKYVRNPQIITHAIGKDQIIFIFLQTIDDFKEIAWIQSTFSIRKRSHNGDCRIAVILFDYFLLFIHQLRCIICLPKYIFQIWNHINTVESIRSFRRQFSCKKVSCIISFIFDIIRHIVFICQIFFYIICLFTVYVIIIILQPISIIAFIQIDFIISNISIDIGLHGSQPGIRVIMVFIFIKKYIFIHAIHFPMVFILQPLDQIRRSIDKIVVPRNIEFVAISCYLKINLLYCVGQQRAIQSIPGAALFGCTLFQIGCIVGNHMFLHEFCDRIILIPIFGT